MLEIKDVHNYYTGEEDLLFPLITTDTKDRLYKSNNWKKMHHIPLKATSINGYKIVKLKQEYCSSRSRKKQKKFIRKHFFTPNWEDIYYIIKGDKTMNRKPIESFDNLKNGDLIISPIDNEVTQYLEGKDGNKYLANKTSMYPLYQFDEKDFYFYEGTKEIGEVDTTC